MPDRTAAEVVQRLDDLLDEMKRRSYKLTKVRNRLIEDTDQWNLIRIQQRQRIMRLLDELALEPANRRRA